MHMDVTDLPKLNVTLNLIVTFLLTAGYVQIRRGDMRRHKACMVAACVGSAAFLASYLIYHWQVGSVPFEKQGWIRPVYFTILISHIVLAITIVPMVVITLTRAFGGAFERHRRIAVWTWPLWMYVSVTGVLVYCMLYVL